MSVPAIEQTNSFFAPLKGKVAVLLLHDKATKMTLSRFLMRCAYLQAASATTSILDADAFYCTNIDELTEEIKDDYNNDADRFFAETKIMLLPEKPFKVSHLIPLISSKTQVLILDDLNSLYSLASNNRKSHELSIFMKLLSHNAKMNKSWVIATAYRTERGEKASTNGHSLAGLGDTLVDTELRGGSLLLKASLEGYWPNNELSL
jgi:hypothetical protein